MAINPIIRGNQNTTKLANDLKKSMNTYKVLSKEEERDLIEKYRNDRKTLNDLLFKHNIRIVFNLAKRYKSQTDDFDSLIQDGMHGLAIAIDKFNIDAGTKLITYAVPWVLKKIRENFNKKNIDVEKKSISLNSITSSMNMKSTDTEDVELENYINDYIDKSMDNNKTMMSTLSANEQIEICKELYDILENDSSLSATEKNVFREAFYDKEKTRILAEKYSLAMKDITNIKTKILKKMKTILHDRFNIDSYNQFYSC